MSKRLEVLREKLAELEARQSSERAELVQLTEADDLDDEQELRYNQLDARFNETGVWVEQKVADETRSQIAKLEAILSAPVAAREVAPSPTVWRQQPDPLKDEATIWGPTDQVRAAARTAIENIPQTSDEVRKGLYATLERCDDPMGKVARHMIAASRPEYRSAFSKIISGRQWALTPDEVRAVDHVRAITLTDANGGYNVPTVTDPTLILTGAHNGFFTTNVVRQLANVRQIAGDNLNVISTAGMTASFVAAETEATDNAPTFSTLALTPHKAHTFVPFDIEIQEDWPAMETELRRLILIAKDDLELEKFTLGTGTNEPFGVVYDIYTNYTGQVQASVTANDYTLPDVYALKQKVALRYQTRGVFMANEVILDETRGFGGTTYGLWGESLVADRPSTLIGKPVYPNAAMDSTYGSGENYVALFGDMNAGYTIVDRIGLSVELIPHLFGSTNNYPMGMRGLYAWWRTGARVTNSEALAVLNVT